MTTYTHLQCHLDTLATAIVCPQGCNQGMVLEVDPYEDNGEDYPSMRYRCQDCDLEVQLTLGYVSRQAAPDASSWGAFGERVYARLLALRSKLIVATCVAIAASLAFETWKTWLLWRAAQ